jgi:hypothetical protein
VKYWLTVAVSVRLFAGGVSACTKVDGDRIRGAELAAADARFAALDPSLDFGPAPLAGVRRVFRESELRRVASMHGIANAPSELCFERATQVLTADRLQPILQSALSGEQVEILDFSKYVVPQGTLEFARSGLAASGFWRGYVMYGENRGAAVWVKIRVADSGASRVERGETVRVEVRSGGVLLAFAASAESSGRTGEQVIVKNPQNGRPFQARVEGKGKVSVQK